MTNGRAIAGVPNSSEKALLLACARSRITPAISAEIRRITSGPIDWSLLLRSAAENSVLPLLALNLPLAASDLFSPDDLERLRSAARAAAIRSLQLSAELVRVMEGLREKNITAFPYKGLVLAVQAYGDLALREFEDLDIVLRQRDMPRAHEALSLLGYRPRYPFSIGGLVPGEYSYSKNNCTVIVELHTEQTLRHFPRRPDLDAMERRARPVVLGGPVVSSFGPEDTLILLSVHGAKDFWARLSWVTDVAEFVQRYADLNWDLVLREASTLKVERMFFLALSVAKQALGASVPAEIERRVQRDAQVRSDADAICRRLAMTEPPSWSAAGAFHFRRRLGGWRYATRLATAPAQEDTAMVRLPKALAPLYVAIRPLRLLAKYGFSAKV